MNRRATLATLFGRRALPSLMEASSPPVVTSGLEPYSGSWAFEQAAHLLRRSMFGPTIQQIKDAVNTGLDATLEQLFTELPLPDPPLNYDYEDDPYVAIGESWVDAPYPLGVEARAYRRRSNRAWHIGQFIAEGVSIREKMTLFWHNHFAISNINDPKYSYKHISLLRSFAWGNFRELVKRVTVDPSMLRFLNGNQNTAVAPNENYARELLELFTIGKGPVAGPGDYTNYTEEDVIQIARVLTGWNDVGYYTIDPEVEVGAIFRPNRHDQGEKQLSPRFDNLVITNMGNEEYAYLVDVIFQKEEVARFISRKLYRWFIYYNIDENAEANVIEPMAQLLIDNDYEIQPALQALLGSQHFFDFLNVGPMIKNPLDFMFSIMKQTEVQLPEALAPYYTHLYRFHIFTNPMQMVFLDPPNVAGWKAYYQEPSYYRIWINASTLPTRMLLSDTLATTGVNAMGTNVKIDVLQLITTLEDPLDVNALINELAMLLFPQPITDGQLDALKEVLIPGLPDYEWSLEYGNYLSDPDNIELASAVETKLRNLIRVMLSMPEFYLS